MLSFQLTASRRGWLRCVYFYSRQNHFNSQPHEEADKWRLLQVGDSGYFNSQPHEEADKSESGDLLLKNISTHSLTKRLTKFLWIFLAYTDISTHSLTKRLTSEERWWTYPRCISTHSLTKRLTMMQDIEENTDVFQLTASRRGWQSPQSTVWCWVISTHSLTKRLTAQTVHS